MPPPFGNLLQERLAREGRKGSHEKGVTRRQERVSREGKKGCHEKARRVKAREGVTRRRSLAMCAEWGETRDNAEFSAAFVGASTGASVATSG